MEKYCTSPSAFTPEQSVEFARQNERNRALAQQQLQAPTFTRQQPSRSQSKQASFSNQRLDPRFQNLNGQDVRGRTPKAHNINNPRGNSGFLNQVNKRDARYSAPQTKHLTSREQFTRDRAIRLLGL